MFAELCTCMFNRLITYIPKSGKPPLHASTHARMHVTQAQNSNYANIVAWCVYVVAVAAPLELAR